MADNSVPTQAGAFELQFQRMAGQIRCAMPGNISSFDPATQRCSVVPGIKLKTVAGNKVSYLNLPEIQNVPIVVPYAQAAGVLLTLPIKAGDPCLLVFSDRAIDNFVQKGDAQIPGSVTSEDTTTPRQHHLSDAICIPGFISDPNVVPEWHEENIEIRDFDRKHFISLGPDGITISDSEATWNMKGGKVKLDAPSGIEETSEGPIKQTTSAPQTIIGSNIAIDGNGGGSGTYEIDKTLKSREGTFIDKDNVNLNAHVHTNVQPGPSNTGKPQK